MNQIRHKKLRSGLIGLGLCVTIIGALVYVFQGETANNEALKEARRILPGYSIAFNGQTNVIQRCGSLRAFSRQHEMMEYLQLFAPYVEQYNHPTNHPIMIRETDDRVIIELPSRVKFPPYNWTIYWGSDYRLKIEFDKKTKMIVDAVQG
jgi:hypothetical protein